MGYRGNLTPGELLSLSRSEGKIPRPRGQRWGKLGRGVTTDKPHALLLPSQALAAKFFDFVHARLGRLPVEQGVDIVTAQH